MKTLKELGVSPTPWRHAGDGLIGDREDNLVARASACGSNEPDACMLAAAPELYEALFEIVGEMCIHCDLQDACREGEDGMSSPCNMVHKARAALMKAAGESEGMR